MNERRIPSVNHYFKSNYDISLGSDKYQEEYVKSILSSTEEVQAVFIDAPAGTGKTMLAVQAGNYMLETGKISKMYYVRSAVSIREQGFLPGDIAEKESYYMRPVKDSLNKFQQNRFEQLITQDKLECLTTTFARGIDLSGDILLIIDEAQNLNILELQAMLTRPHDTVKIVVIGSSLQIDDLYAKKYGKEGLTPFELYIKHFEKNPFINTKQLKLVNNYRGKFSQYADEIRKTIIEEEKISFTNNV